MKNTFTLLIMLLIVASCSKDDTIEESNNGNIVGTWGLYKDTFDDNRIEEHDMSNPENQMTFNSDGTIDVYLSDDGINILSTISGTWKHLGGTKYEVHMLILQETDIEFLSDNEFRAKYVNFIFDEEEGREWGHYKRIK